MDRYRYVLISELGRMTTAQRARTFHRRDSLAWGLLTGLIGLLFSGPLNAPNGFMAPCCPGVGMGSIRSLDD